MQTMLNFGPQDPGPLDPETLIYIFQWCCTGNIEVFLLLVLKKIYLIYSLSGPLTSFKQSRMYSFQGPSLPRLVPYGSPVLQKIKMWKAY